METTIVGYTGYILGLYRDNGKMETQKSAPLFRAYGSALRVCHLHSQQILLQLVDIICTMVMRTAHMSTAKRNLCQGTDTLVPSPLPDEKLKRTKEGEQ